MKSIHSIYIAVFIIILSNVAVMAHGDIDHNAGYCQNAKTTADLVACTKTRLDSENKKLGDLFNAVQAVYTDAPDTQSTIADNQANWVTYRDTLCAVEAHEYEGESLSVVQETSCLARVTYDRANHYLVMLRARDETAVPVFSNPPRWVNVLGADYDDVYWAISSKQNIDVDCDGVDEVVLSGLQQQKDDAEHKTIIAIADSEKTGRPLVTLLPFNNVDHCNVATDSDVNLIDEEDKPVVASCSNAISSMVRECAELIVKYDNDTKVYQLETNKIIETTKEEDKND